MDPSLPVGGINSGGCTALALPPTSGWAAMCRFALAAAQAWGCRPQALEDGCCTAIAEASSVDNVAAGPPRLRGAPQSIPQPRRTLPPAAKAHVPRRAAYTRTRGTRAPAPAPLMLPLPYSGPELSPPPLPPGLWSSTPKALPHGPHQLPGFDAPAAIAPCTEDQPKAAALHHSTGRTGRTECQYPGHSTGQYVKPARCARPACAGSNTATGSTALAVWLRICSGGCSSQRSCCC